MDAPNNPTYEYQVGGSLKINAPCYVWRQADDDLYASLQGGEFCYVFNCRQMGKSSLRVQVMQRLKAEGFSCGAIDLTTIGSGEITADKWYRGLILELNRIFKLSKQVNLKTWLADSEQLPPVQRLSLYLEEVLLAQVGGERIVIFIDEIDSVLKLNFPTSDFFALIRACYNQRADNPAFERLTFVLLGVATPADLVQDARQTPFNIGRAIALGGLEFEKSAILAEGLVGKAENPQQVLQEILQWTGGQPFLTQKLCQIVRERAGEVIRAGEEAERVQQLVQAQILDNWEFQDDPQHLRTIRDRLLNNEQKAGRLLGLYQQILEQGGISADGSPGQVDLQLTGLVVKRGDKLEVYNPIYREVFNRSWVEEKLTQLRPSFYAEAIKAWLVSGKQDESRLLRGLALQEAQEWAKGKSLGDKDYQFLRASEQLETEAEREAKAILARANQTLEEANKKARQRIRIGSAILIISLVLAAIATATALTLNKNNGQLRIQNLSLSQQKEGLEEDIQKAEKEVQIKNEKFRQAETKFKIALTNQQKAQQLALLAKGNQQKAEQARKQAETDLAQAKNERQIAIQDVEVAKVELGKLKQERQAIKQQLQIEQAKLRKAKEDLFIAKKATQLEQEGINALKAFETRGIDGLLLAMQTGATLKKITKSKKSLTEYPATSPIYALTNILTNIREFNKIDSNMDVLSIGLSSDGKILAFGGGLTIWNLERGLMTFQIETFNQINHLALNGDGKIIITEGDLDEKGHDESNIIKVRRQDGTLIANLTGHNSRVTSVAISADGTLIASGDLQGIIKLWKSDGTLIKTVYAHQKAVNCIVFSRNGKGIASGSEDGIIKLWKSDGTLVTSFSGHENSVHSIAISPDGTLIASWAEYEDDIKIWLPDGTVVGKIPSERQSVSLSFSLNGKLIISGEADGIRLWERSSSPLYDLSQFPIGSYRKYGMFRQIAFSPNGSFAASVGADDVIRLWKLNDTPISVLGRYNTGLGWEKKIIQDVAFSPDGHLIAFVRNNGTIELWNREGIHIKTLTANNTTKISFNPDGKMFVSVSLGGIIRLWKPDGTLIKSFSGHLDNILSIAFSPDGQMFASASSDGIKLWKSDGTLIRAFEEHKSWVNVLRFSPDGQILASAGHDYKITLRKLNGTLIKTFNQGTRSGDFVTSLDFSPDGQILAIGIRHPRKDGSVELRKLDGTLISTLTGHEDSVNSIKFSPDGKMFASGGKDATIKLWKPDGTLITTLTGHTGEINSINFSPDGQNIASASSDGTVILWSLNLDDLLAKGCLWLQDYLTSHPDEAQDVRQICQNYTTPKAKR